MPRLIFASEMLMEPKDLPLVFWDAALPFVEIIRDELFEQLEPGEESEWVFQRIATRLAIADDTVRDLAVNLIQLSAAREY